MECRVMTTEETLNRIDKKYQEMIPKAEIIIEIILIRLRNPRHEDLIRSRYGIGKPIESSESVAKRLCISSPRVRCLEYQILRRYGIRSRQALLMSLGKRSWRCK